MKKIFLGISLLLLLACGEEEVADRSGIEWQDIQKELQEALLIAEAGDTIKIPAGYFHFDKSLLMDDIDTVTIQGAGMDQTFLSFKDQSEGAEGLKISNCSAIQLLNFTIEDAAGDNIKVNDTDGIIFRNVKSQWTGQVSETNGAYAFYPVLCKNVLIENCIAIGASDAGIYVGQSDTVIIRNNIASQNVAGIESENSNMVEIYGNKATNNTGGILVFDLPGLTQYGEDIKVYDNLVQSNNHSNFAPAGNIVGVVPPGTGVMILATSDVEIYENRVFDNRTVGVAVISYELVAAISEEDEKEVNDTQDGSAQIVNNNYALDSAYDAFPNGISIYKNEIYNSHWFATFAHDFGILFNYKFPFSPPDIIFDGFIESEVSSTEVLCINQPDAKFVYLDAPHDLAGMNEDVSPYLCE
ncbi:MAG: parallel beta-helix repeat protein [Marivirga sp.]|jgi:parallel beta-helix repeat protein